MFVQQLPGALNVSLLLSIRRSRLFSVEKTTKHASATSVKDCAYTEALQDKHTHHCMSSGAGGLQHTPAGAFIWAVQLTLQRVLIFFVFLTENLC